MLLVKLLYLPVELHLGEFTDLGFRLFSFDVLLLAVHLAVVLIQDSNELSHLRVRQICQVSFRHHFTVLSMQVVCERAAIFLQVLPSLLL